MDVEAALEVRADDGVRLAGALRRPVGHEAAPAALLVNGAPGGSPPGLAQALAAALAERGVASLRMEPRAGPPAGFDRGTADAAAALAALRAAEGVDPARVSVVGHAAGAAVAVRLAAGDAGLAGAVLLCAAARSGEEAMRGRAERVAASLTGARRAGARRAGRREARARARLHPDPDGAVRVHGRELPARWVREYALYDPADDLPRVRCPVLAVTGAKDLEADPADVARIGELALGPVEAEVPDDLTHVLRRDPGPPGLAAYPALLAQPVDAALLDRVAAWAAALGLRPGGGGRG